MLRVYRKEINSGPWLLRGGRCPARRWELLGGLQIPKSYHGGILGQAPGRWPLTLPSSLLPPTKPDIFPSGVAGEWLCHFPETPAEFMLDFIIFVDYIC